MDVQRTGGNVEGFGFKVAIGTAQSQTTANILENRVVRRVGQRDVHIRKAAEINRLQSVVANYVFVDCHGPGMRTGIGEVRFVMSSFNHQTVESARATVDKSGD